MSPPAARRRNDDYPDNKRRDDIALKAFGMELNANGKTVVNVLLAASILTAFWLLYAFQESEAQARRDEHDLFALILTMKQEDREKIQPYLRVPRGLATVVKEIQTDKAATDQRDETKKFGTK